MNMAGCFIFLIIQIFIMFKGESGIVKMKGKVAWLLLLVVSLLANGSQALAYEVQLKPYKDVTEQDWAGESIYRLMSYGVISGYEDGTYRPDSKLTREAFIKLLVSAIPPKTDGKRHDFPKDVASSRWSHAAIKQALEAGWLDTLIAYGKLNPGEGIRREEVAVLSAYAFMQDAAETEIALWLTEGWLAARERAAFRDADAIEQALAPYVYKAFADNLMQGDVEGRFLPDKPLNRREAAKIIDRIIQQRTGSQTIEVAAFYAAGGPYKKHDRMADADEIIFDWAKLAYNGNGEAGLTLAEPQDRAQVLDSAAAGQTKASLMVFGNTLAQQLGEFVMDKPAHQAFAKAISAAVAGPQAPYGGVVIDFEGLVSSEHKEAFGDLLLTVKKELGSGKELTVAVPPAYYYAGYDYKRIGEIADKVVLMAYDFTHEASRLPSAPLPLAADALRMALRDIPADKLLLGISKQANQWSTKEDGTVEFFRSPAIAAVESRLADSGTSSVKHLPYFLNHMTFKDVRGSHELWYEDSESVAEKIRLAKAFGLRGVAVWQINQLTDEDWRVITTQA